MMRNLTMREQRLAALFLLLAVVALVWLLLVRPIASGFADRSARRDLLMATYARDEQVIGQLPSMGRAATAQRRDASRFRLAAADENVATSALIERLGGTVTAVGGELGAVENVAGSPGRVRARVECRLTMPQFAALLERLQNDPPLLVVDALAIGANDAGEQPRPGLMGVRVEASIFYSAAASR